MQDRIEINGVWYVRESSVQIEDLDPTNFEGCVVENNDFCIEATRLIKKQYAQYESDIDLKVTDKRGGKGKCVEHRWDNNAWMVSVMQNSQPAVDSLKEGLINLELKHIQYFQAFFKYLSEVKLWLKH